MDSRAFGPGPTNAHATGNTCLLTALSVLEVGCSPSPKKLSFTTYDSAVGAMSQVRARKGLEAARVTAVLPAVAPISRQDG